MSVPKGQGCKPVLNAFVIFRPAGSAELKKQTNKNKQLYDGNQRIRSSENIIEHTSSLNPQIQVQKYKIER